jgi:octaprenyl-diphosphate synthase
MIQGVSLQTFFRRKKISETTYLEINYLKSGSLFECAAAIGGLVGSNNPRDIETLAAFGKSFGNAYQIRDDLCGVFTENVQDDLSRNDILNGDISLPLIYALESDGINGKDSAYLVSVYSGMSKNPDIKEIQRIYEESGALQRSIARMKSFADTGRKHINNFQDSEAKEILIHLLDRYYSKFNPKIKMEVLL